LLFICATKLLGGITVNGVYKSLERANINLLKTKTGRKRIPHLELRKFLWDTFASHYIELIKARAYNQENKFLNIITK
jgi:hypothetical protein